LVQVPEKWERLGAAVLLPEQSFASAFWEIPEVGHLLWPRVAAVLKTETVAKQSEISPNGIRESQAKILWGGSGFVTQLENGVSYSFDITKCMFSSGNGTEKARMASLNCLWETVVDLYCGIGYYTLPILVKAGAKHVYACDWNPEALKAIRYNLVSNNVADRCTVFEGDNRKLAPKGVADRVLLGLIPTSEPGDLSHLENIPLRYLPLVPPREYSISLTSHWSHLENIPLF
jgi:tRNA wybutosine-synthesizing protein 3